jgi:phosphinothricin acetyltransferase
MKIRPARDFDLDPIVSIYNHYVVNSIAIFDETPSSIEDRLSWFRTFDVTGPYRLLVAEGDNEILGYACSSPYRNHLSFTETVEFGISLSPESRGRGLGTTLYTRLIEDLRSEQLHRAVAGIALPNEASVRLHRRLGFRDVGVFDEYAKKWDRYISSVWMQRNL